MFQTIRHAFNVIHSVAREAVKRVARSPEWRRVEKDFLSKNASCAACGKSKRLQVHHVKPFHEYPSLELDEKNLIALCMGGKECHLKIGHGDDFKARNTTVRPDAAEVLANPTDFDNVAATTKAKRLYDG